MTLVSTFKLDIVRFSLPKFGHNYPLDKAYTLYLTLQSFTTFHNVVLFHNIYVAKKETTPQSTNVMLN